MGHRRRYDSLSAVASLAPLFFLFFASTPRTVAQNCTIDDNDFQDQASSIDTPSVTYSPPGAWVQGSECKNCSTTKLDDISQVFNGTWHEALHTPGDLEPRVIRVTFYGRIDTFLFQNSKFVKCYKFIRHSDLCILYCPRHCCHKYNIQTRR